MLEKTLYDVSSWMGVCLNLPLSGLLVYLILTKTDRAMVNYSRLLLVGVVIDSLCSCVYFYSEMQLEMSEGYLFHRGGGVLSISSPPQCFYSAVYGTASVMVYISLPIQSVYRYYSIIKSRQLPFYAASAMYLVPFLAMCPLALYNAAVYAPLTESPVQMAAFRKLEKWNEFKDVESTFCGTEILNPGVLCFCAALCFFSTSSLLVVVYTSAKIHKYLDQSKTSFSYKTYNLHRQLEKLLMAQTVIPAISAVVLVLIMAIAFAVRSYSGGILLLLFIACPLVCAINPLATILFISRYRTCAIRILFLRKAVVSDYTPSIVEPKFRLGTSAL